MKQRNYREKYENNSDAEDIYFLNQLRSKSGFTKSEELVKQEW